MAGEQITMVPVYAALVGGTVSFIGAAGITWWTSHLKQKHDSRQLAKAFKGEITALVHITQLRDYAGGLRKLAQWCKENNAVGNFSVASREEYRIIYKANASNIGILHGALPEQIAILYTQTASLQEDFKTLDEIYTGTRRASFNTPLDAASKFIAMADLIDETFAMASVTLKEIDRVYPD